MSEKFRYYPEHLVVDAGGEYTTEWSEHCALMLGCADQWDEDLRDLKRLQDICRGVYLDNDCCPLCDTHGNLDCPICCIGALEK